MRIKGNGTAHMNAFSSRHLCLDGAEGSSRLDDGLLWLVNILLWQGTPGGTVWLKLQVAVETVVDDLTSDDEAI